MTEKPKIAAIQPIQCKIEANKEYLYCTCGHAKEQPFCDGSHKSTSFKPLLFTSPVTTYEPICACKQTRLSPYCDGRHSRL